MKRANFLSVLIIGFFMIVVWPVGAQTAPVGYFQHGDWYCNSDTNFEKPGNVLGQKFCQPQITGCQAAGGKFCTAGTRNVCCQADSTCGKGTALGLFEVAVCVPPTATTCGPKSPGYAGTTKEGKNICCRAGQEPGPAGGTKAPYCQPASRSACAPGERFIQGAGTFQNEKRCCSANTIPSYHPIGLPFCARLPFTVLAPNGGEQISGLNNRGYYQVRWTTTDIPPDKQIKLSLIDSRASVVFQYMFPNTGSAGLYFSTFPNGQYKIELSVTMDGKTIVDQSDNFFTLTGSNPSPPPPATSGDTTPPTISLSAPLLLSSGTQLTLYATDPSGLTSSSIAVLSPQATIPLFKTCNYNNNRPTLYSCTLAVSKSQWVLGTIVFISAVDYSPNKNVNFESYELVSSGQLRKQDTSGSKIIIPPLTMWCHTFNANLSIGMNGSEVAALQTALTRAGFTVSATGNYGEATAAAVSGFQLKYQSEILTPLGLANPTGYFGPATRQKMNQLYGCGNAAVVPSVPPVTPSVTPSLTVISPAANSSWTSSNGPVIQWSSANIPSGNQIMVELLTPA
ncbi:MAG: peptidoglycan-binding protein, partial [Candidatus Vogelbacteria bacterium]|nr:peptidoglycan-binding protein [Candidatus Vogelbacteria bacterium]